jgi:hypothetical protein
MDPFFILMNSYHVPIGHPDSSLEGFIHHLREGWVSVEHHDDQFLNVVPAATASQTPIKIYAPKTS